MRRPKIIIASAVVALAAAGGITATVALASPGQPAASASQSAGPAAAGPTVQTAQAQVSGKSETILVNAAGLPLYYYQPDTTATSMVSGGLAAAWPPLTAASPTASGANGQLTAVKDTHGSQVAYNGHLLYTFVTDQPGKVTGQGVQNFFVVTPGIAPLAGSAPSSGNVPASPAGGGYGY
jgi:YD repeat-containing protein